MQPPWAEVPPETDFLPWSNSSQKLSTLLVFHVYKHVGQLVMNNRLNHAIFMSIMPGPSACLIYQCRLLHLSLPPFLPWWGGLVQLLLSWTSRDIKFRCQYTLLSLISQHCLLHWSLQTPCHVLPCCSQWLRLSIVTPVPHPWLLGCPRGDHRRMASI